MQLARVLAEFVYQFRTADATQGARETARRCLLDLFGAAIAGHTAPAAHAMRGFAATLLPSGTCSMWLGAGRHHAMGAALGNSAAASALDIDDGHYEAGGHPGASIIPASVAVAEERNGTVGDVLTAIVVGYEVALRIAAARNLATIDTFSTGRWSAFGTVASVAWLRRTDPERLAEALAIGALQVPHLAAIGYSSHKGHGVKEAAPWSTLVGMSALDLAERGLTGPVDFLDYPEFFDRDRIRTGWPHGAAIERVYFKPYSCCRYIHAALDALLGIKEQHEIGHDEITRIRVLTFERGLRFTERAPRSLEAAQFSTPFCLAVAAHYGGAAFLPLSIDLVRRPELLALAAKVEVDVDPALDALFPAQVPARVVLETRRGTFERRVDDPLGDPARPMDVARLTEKFRQVTSAWISRQAQEDLVTAVMSLGEREPVSRLVALLDGAR